MRPPFVEAFFRTSSPEVAPPNLNTDPDGAINIPWEHFGRSADSPEQSYTENQYPHDAIFRIYCARTKLA